MKNLIVYQYRLSGVMNAASYDEAAAVSCIQGLMNRTAPNLYVTSPYKDGPDFWKAQFSKPGGWLEQYTFEDVPDFGALLKLAVPYAKGAVIWDEEVPATFNVATTIAGLEDGVVMTASFRDVHAPGFPVLDDLRGRFDGSETGSAKNDCYRWAIRTLLPRCSGHLLCLFEDSWGKREDGDTRYVVTRDRAVKECAFVYDLSPWDDERPLDDPDAPLGCDKETYLMMLEGLFKKTEGKHMTEVCGFFNFLKYSRITDRKYGGYKTPSDTPANRVRLMKNAENNHHMPVTTEWETVYMISPYNCYQNTIAHDCFNISFHQHYGLHPLKQKRHEKPVLRDKLYICAFHADYDSTTPLYEFMIRTWMDDGRGSFPLTWGIDPNLMESYPDIFDYLYRTLADSDCLTSDASMAGYFNPSRVRPELWDTVVRHNRYYFNMADMRLAPMVLDCAEPPQSALEHIAQIAPDGMGFIEINLPGKPASVPSRVYPCMVNGMPVIRMINTCCDSMSPEMHADILKKKCVPGKTQFALVRNIWKTPTEFREMYEETARLMPEYDIEFVNADQFFALLKEYLEKQV